MSYRDDKEAIAHRARVLERELEERDAEVERLRGENEALREVAGERGEARRELEKAAGRAVARTEPKPVGVTRKERDPLSPIAWTALPVLAPMLAVVLVAFGLAIGVVEVAALAVPLALVSMVPVARAMGAWQVRGVRGLRYLDVDSYRQVVRTARRGMRISLTVRFAGEVGGTERRTIADAVAGLWTGAGARWEGDELVITSLPLDLTPYGYRLRQVNHARLHRAMSFAARRVLPRLDAAHAIEWVGVAGPD